MKPFIYFMAGAAIGSAATFFAVKKYFEQEAERRIQEEVSSVKESYMKRAAAKALADKNSEEKRKRLEALQESDETLSPDPADPKEQETIQEIRRLRRGYSRNIFTDPPKIIDEEEDDEDSDHPSEGLEERPYQISPEEFEQEKTYFDKITIYIYRDDVAVDEQERIVDDLEQLIGEENLSNDDSIVFIRNEMRSADYEVILIDEDYVPESGIPVRD